MSDQVLFIDYLFCDCVGVIGCCFGIDGGWIVVGIDDIDINVEYGFNVSVNVLYIGFYYVFEFGFEVVYGIVQYYRIWQDVVGMVGVDVCDVDYGGFLWIGIV